MSIDDPTNIPKQGWLKVKLDSQTRWHRRYCIIDWDKAILFIATKVDARYRNWIKLLPDIFINEYESSNDNTIEIKADNETHFLQAESKIEYDCWFLALKRTAYSRVGGGIFGQTLEETHKYSRDKTSLIPLIVRQCCEYLLEHGLTFVGLFRIPGKQSSIKELRDMYDRGLTFELNQSYSPATISSLLKIYLQSLPEPMIPMKYFDEFLEIGSCFKYNQTNDIERLKQLIETSLSNISYALLAYLCLFLKKLTEHVQETKMDSDNLAVTFGNNLIRPSEELDLNMIKGHNYNLLPLIKAFIDHSEYLFSNNSVSSNDTCEQNNESIAKSSGFSSFSSLLSSNEHMIRANSRSSSMPSICIKTFSSFDSANISFDCRSDINDVQHRSKPSLEKQKSATSDQLDSHQSFTTCYERDFSINRENNDKSEEQINTVQKRFPSVEKIKDEEKSVILKQKHKSEIPSEFVSKSNVSSPAHKSQKKTFANKFGKSISNFKSNMSKAFHPHYSSVDNILQSNTIDTSPPQIASSTNNEESNSLNDSLKTLQNEISILKDLLDRKDSLLIDLTKASHEERLKYEKEKFQLNQTIEQLQNENSQLKARYQSDSLIL